MFKPYQTAGGQQAYYFRRIFHIVSLTFLPWFYFIFLIQKSSFLMSNSIYFFIALVICATPLEVIRLYFGHLIFGMREYEKHTISGAYWGGLSFTLVFLLAPSPPLGLGIIWCVAWVDPLLGVLREKKVSLCLTLCAGLFLSFSIWEGISFYYELSRLEIAILAVTAVLCELPTLKWVDDCALMMLIPLAITLLWKIA